MNYYNKVRDVLIRRTCLLIQFIQTTTSIVWRQRYNHFWFQKLSVVELFIIRFYHTVFYYCAFRLILFWNQYGLRFIIYSLYVLYFRNWFGYIWFLRFYFNFFFFLFFLLIFIHLFKYLFSAAVVFQKCYQYTLILNSLITF